MAFDDTYELFNIALSEAAGSTVNTTPINLGRVGLPKGSQFTVILDNPSGPANGNLKCDLELSLDNSSTWDVVATIDLGVLTDKFQGQISVDISRSLAWQEYPNDSIDIRVARVSTAGTGTNAASKLAAYITQGEVTKWGRKAGDTLYV